MRDHKSVYRMTDRELREYKRMQRRRKLIQCRIFSMIVTACVIAFCAVSYHGIRSMASNGTDDLKFKYYTQVTVQSINHLTEEDTIRSGQSLIVPYYSYDFVK